MLLQEESQTRARVGEPKLSLAELAALNRATASRWRTPRPKSRPGSSLCVADQ